MDSKANREDAGETDNEYREIISHLGNREKDIGLVQQPALLNPDGFGLLNKSRKRLHLLLVL
jgi:hypothetical protein